MKRTKEQLQILIQSYEEDAVIFGLTPEDRVKLQSLVREYFLLTGALPTKQRREL